VGWSKGAIILDHLLLLLLVIPLFAVVGLALFNHVNLKIYRRLAIGGVSLPLLPLFYLIYEAVHANLDMYNIHFNSKVNIFSFSYGIDSVSLWLTVTTSIVLLVAVLLAVYIKKRQKQFYALVPLIQCIMFHIYLSRDALLLCASLLLLLFLMTFLIGVWSEQEGAKTARRFAYRQLAGIFCITMSCILLLNISSDYLQSSTILIGEQRLLGLEQYILSDEGLQRQLAFVMLLLGLLCLFPIIGLHRLYLDIHRNSHLLVTIIYNTTIGTIGVYIGYRLGLTYFADMLQAASEPIIWLMTVQWLFSCISLWHQKDVKGWLAYSIWGQSSLLVMLLLVNSELGLTMLWLHLISSQLLVGLLGGLLAAIGERTKDLSLEGLRGQLKPVPFLRGLFIVALLAWLGLPGLSHFLGTYHAILFSFPISRWITACLVLGLISSIAFAVRMLFHVQHNDSGLRYKANNELRFIEAFPSILLLTLIIVLGCYPIIVVDVMESQFQQLYSFWGQIEAGTAIHLTNLIEEFAFNSNVWELPVILSVVMSLAIWLVNHKQSNLFRMLIWQAVYHMLTLIVVISSAQALSVTLDTGRILLISCWYLIMLIGYYSTIRAVIPKEEATLSGIQGLYHRQPRHSFLLLLFNLALMSAPLTAGFTFQLYMIELWNLEGQYGLIMLWLVGHVLMATIPLEAIIQMYMYGTGSLSWSQELPRGLRDGHGKLRGYVLLSYISLLLVLGLAYWI